MRWMYGYREGDLRWLSKGTVAFKTGKMEAFVVDTEGGLLYRIPDGPSAHHLLEIDSLPDLSPDETRVVYSSLRYSFGGWPWNRLHSYEIATAKLDGTDHKRLTKDEYDNLTPRWSPGGTSIAFLSARDTTGKFDLYVMDADGSNIRLVGGGWEKGQILPIIKWAPDGSHIAVTQLFIEYDYGQIWIEQSISTVKMDGNDFEYRNVADFKSKVSTVPRSLHTRTPVWSPDSRHLAFIGTRDEVDNIITIAPDGSERRQLTHYSDKGAHTIRNLFWSIDSSEIRFITAWESGDEHRSGVFAINTDDGTIGRLTSGPHIPWTSRMAWLADGSRVASMVLNETLMPLSQSVFDLLYTTAFDGSDRQVLVTSNFGVIQAANSGRLDDAADCSTGGAVSNPNGNTGLVQDCETLLNVRDALAGEGAELNWRVFVPIERWTGITVSGSPKRVEVLRFGYGLTNAKLSGTIPPELENLPELKVIVLAQQHLSGEIPPELGNLAKLQKLDLDENGLTGRLPSEFGDLTELESLQLTRNSLEGSIPPELGKLTKLRELLLSQNKLTGPVPPELGALKNLDILVIHGNSLTGCVPSSLTDNPKLEIHTWLEPC